MQENIARKRALLLQKPDRWSYQSSNGSKKARKERHRRLSRPGHDIASDPAFSNVDITHPHVPVMEDESMSQNIRRRSGDSPKRSHPGAIPRASTQLSHNGYRRSQEEDDSLSNSASDLEDYLKDEDDEEAGLTHAERKRKRRWRRRDMRFNSGIASSGDVSKEQDTMWSTAFFRANAMNALLIGSWYTFSIAISVYNKWMFSDDNLHFPFPLFTTCAHMVVQFTLSGAVLFFVPRFRPRASASISSAHGYSHVSSDEETAAQEKERKPQIMTPWFYLSRIGPCGAATAMDIGLGNFSLRFISLAFYTMCKSSVLAFVLLFAFLFRLEKPSWKLGAIIGVMTIGVVLMVAGETVFNVIGFMLVMTASLCSGFRWSLTQILLLRNSTTSNPFSSIFFLTPVMFLCLLVLALPIEGPLELLAGFQELAAVKGYVLGVLIMMAPGILAFMMVAAEFALLQRTSVVTLSVCGIFKEVLTIATAARTFGDELSTINISGLVVTIFAIAAYNYLKYLKMKEVFEKKSRGIAMKQMNANNTHESASASAYAEPRNLTRHSVSSLPSADSPAESSLRMNGASHSDRSPISEKSSRQS